MDRTNHPAVLLFGDVTDPWHDGIDYVYSQATTTPWMQSFLDNLFTVFKEETKNMDRVMRDNLGACSSLQELAQKYRHSGDEFRMAHAMLLYTVRAVLSLETVAQNPHLLTTHNTSTVNLLGISGGLISAAAVSVAHSFDTLYEACLEAGRVWTRLCNLTLVRSRSIEGQPGVWGWAVLGIAPDQLAKLLEQFQSARGIPSAKRARIGVTGDRWSTIIGPPTVLETIWLECSALQKVPRNELNIRAMQHTLDISEADLDYIVGSGPLMASHLRPNTKVWGLADPNATYTSWGQLLRAAAKQTLSQPLDIVQAIGKLETQLGNSPSVEVKLLGPSSHASYLVKALETAVKPTRKVLVEDRLVGAKPLTDLNADVRGKVAIVGMAGKGPGSDDLEAFWKIILEGQDLHQEIPADRFDVQEYLCAKHGPTGAGQCTMTCRHGCFIKEPGQFDAKFFHISPREALLMEPGHRLFLMNAYEALEAAGYSGGKGPTDPNKIAVFFGQCTDDWHMVGHHALGCDAFTLQSVQRAFGPGRLAFQMKWEGPTYALDSACASASSCIHLACTSLLARDVDMAVAGAANVLSTPHSFTSLSRSGVLSDTGNCKTYRDDADGYCRADFSGAVVLKRLEDAIAHNDNILAVVGASARNHSGNSKSITTSDSDAQERLFNKVLRNARLSPDDISYVEMHGTGTQVGDKAEMGAVSHVFSGGRASRLPVGAIKANIGHSEAAAGMSSLLKSILMFQRGIIPPQAGMPHPLNPNFPPLEDINITIPSTPSEFIKPRNKPRRILLNNFDAAGGNACLILEEYQNQEKTSADVRSAHVVATSARTQPAHLKNMTRLLRFLQAQPETRIQDIAYTTTARRVHHPIRFALTAATTQEAIQKLEAEVSRVTDGGSSSTARPAHSSTTEMVFVFTGQGSHYAGMGAELYRTSPAFRAQVDLCASIGASHGFPDFLELITNPRLDISSQSPAQVQLAVVTLELALVAFWCAAGLEPAMAIGHSLGEYAAMYAAGVLSLADTLYLVGNRARLLLERCEPDTCAMLALYAPVTAVRDILARAGPNSLCEVACVNGPNATVVSGPSDELAQLQAEIAKDDVQLRSKMLSVPFAFHSFQMDAILEDYEALAAGVSFLPPKIPIASTLLGAVVDSSGVFGPDYLVQQTRQAVNFSGALDAAQTRLHDPIWLEIGPASVCGSFVKASLAPPPTKVLHSVDPSTGNWLSISKALKAAYSNGLDIDWLGLNAPYEKDLALLNLPTYGWDTKNYWITHTDRPNEAAPQKTLAPSMEPFVATCAQYLVRKSKTPKAQVTFRTSLADPGFLGLIDGHKMQGIGLASGSVFCDAAMTAAKHVLEYQSDGATVNITSLTLHEPELLAPVTRRLVGTDGNFWTTATVDGPAADSILVTFKATNVSETTSIDLGSIRVRRRDPAAAQASWDRMSYFIHAKMDERIRQSKDGVGHRMQPSVVYALFANAVEFSPAFQGIEEAYMADDFQEAAATIMLKEDPAGTNFTTSPYWGEALLHLAGFMVNGNPTKSPLTTFIVMGFGSVEQTEVLRPGKQYMTYTRIARWEKETAFCDAFVFDPENGRLILQCTDLRYTELPRATWKHILDGPHAGASHGKAAHAPKAITSQAAESKEKAQPKVPAVVHSTKAVTRAEQASSSGVNAGAFALVVQSIAKATGADPSDLTDDTAIADVGVDSIMAIEVVATVKELGVDLPATFVFQFPTIGDLRREFQEEVAATNDNVPEREPVQTSEVVTSSSSEAREASQDESMDGVNISTPASVSSPGSSIVHVDAKAAAEANDRDSKVDTSPLPSVRITLLQGRPGRNRTPLYMMADGTGTIATYIHLPPFKTKRPVYGIDSPFFRCPSRMTTQVGIEGVSRLVVESLLKAQPTGPLRIGGFSAGCMVAFEVSRQLAAAGRTVEGLLLIDMCCPRERRLDPQALLEEDEFSFGIFEAAVAKDGMWSSHATTRDHFRAYFLAMNSYTPVPMTASERPVRTAVIWAEKGLVNRVKHDPKLMLALEEQGVPTKSYPGFMTDPKHGTFACMVPDKGLENLGPNGWDKFTSGEVLAMSVDGDHLDVPMPGHVHLLHAQMEKAFAYFDSA